MIEVLQQGGPLAQVAFGAGLLGILVAVMACGMWFVRCDLKRAAMGAIDRASGESSDPNILAFPRRDEDPEEAPDPLPPGILFKIGRDAALAAAFPASGVVLMAAITLWALTMVALAWMTLVRQPDAMVVADVMRGSLQLPPGMSPQTYFSLVSRALVAGSMTTLMVVPATVVAALCLGFLRSWLLGGPLDRTLLAVIARVDPEGRDPDLAKLKADFLGCARRRWTVTGWLAAPIWFLARRQFPQAVILLAALGLSWGLALLAWYLPAKLVWGGEPLLAGTDAGVIWHYLREPLTVLFTLPVWIYAGLRGNR